MIRDPISVSKAFQARVAKLTNGAIVFVQQLAELSIEASIQFAEQDLIDVLDFVPSLLTVEALCASSSAFKANGEDAIPG